MVRSEQTEQQYKKKLDCIVNRYSDGEFPEKSEAFDAVFSKLRDAGLATKTMKMYRSVLYWYAAQIGLELDHSNYQISQEVKKSNKQKRYDLRKRERLLSHIDKIPKPYREFVYLHLIVGALVGYRLIEIPSIQVEEVIGRLNITIKNGKYSNGRSIGEFRKFSIPSKYGEIELAPIIERLSELARMDDYSDFLRKAADAHGRLSRKLFGKEAPTLSSLRHQFKLNMVAANKDGLAISAAFGHASSETQKKNYGINRGGKGLVSEQEVAFFEQVSVPQSMIDLVRNKRPSLDKLRAPTAISPVIG